MSPDKQARAEALRAHLSAHAPEVAEFLDLMKGEFGATVLYVNAAGVEQGKEPAPGLKPYLPLPASTWAYGVGQTAGDLYMPAVQKQKKVRRARR